MSEKIVSKFGGTSNATAEAIGHCLDLADSHQIMVVSAPGRLSQEQLDSFAIPTDVSPDFLCKKVTDQLLEGRRKFKSEGEVPDYVTESITARYAEGVCGLSIGSLKGSWLQGITNRTRKAIETDDHYASMLGEILQAELYSALGRRMLNPTLAKSPLLPREENAWKEWVQSQINQHGRYVWPGNIYSDGVRPWTFERGGSDISGALAAYSAEADVYWNMTDTPAQSADPKLVPDERRLFIPHLTYLEGRELGRNGTGLLHPEAIVPLMGSGIPTEVRNTFDPEGPFTLYTDKVDDENRRGRVMAISLIPEIGLIRVHEPGMSESHGRVRSMLDRLDDRGINLIDDIGYGSDTQIFLVNGNEGEVAASMLRDVIIRKASVTAEHWSLLTLVGYELGRDTTAARLALIIDAGLNHKNLGIRPYFFDGAHSLRVTVPREMAEKAVDDAHYRLIEEDPYNRRLKKMGRMMGFEPN